MALCTNVGMKAHACGRCLFNLDNTTASAPEQGETNHNISFYLPISSAGTGNHLILATAIQYREQLLATSPCGFVSVYINVEINIEETYFYHCSKEM